MLATVYMHVDVETMDSLCRQALELSQKLNFKTGEAVSLLSLGNAFLMISNYDSALSMYQRALSIFQQIPNNSEHTAKTLYNIGLAYFYQGNTAKAMSYLVEAVSLYDKLNDKEEQANVMNAIASVYATQGEFGKALRQYQSILEIAESLGYDRLLDNIYHNISSAYFDWYESQPNTRREVWLDSALYYNRKALAIRKKQGNKSGIAACLISLGNIYNAQKKYGLALEAYGSALKSKIELNDRRGQAICYENMAEVNLKLKHLGLAIQSIENAIAIYREIESPQDMLTALQMASEIYSTIGNYKSAFEALKQYIVLSDSIFTKEKASELAEMEAKYELIKKTAENHRQDAQLQKERFRNQFFVYSIAVAIVLIAVMVVLFVQANRNRLQAIRINAELRSINQELARREEEVRNQSEILIQANEEISSTNEALTRSQNRLAEINQDLTSSITYAKTIQNALLPTLAHLREVLPVSFAFLRPKDMVSGDLFWVHHFGSLKLVAAIDCTGHGVPGGFMSITAVFLLNQICRTEGITRPDLILKRLDEALRKVLRQDAATIKDGMELSICLWDEQAHKLLFAGARCGLVYIADGKLTEIKGDRLSIGGEYREKSDFTLHQIDIQTKTICYLYTDGFQDQFGGPKGKKFMGYRFKELLLSIHSLPMNDQMAILESTFLDWIGSQNNQIDDVLVLGFEVS